MHRLSILVIIGLALHAHSAFAGKEKRQVGEWIEVKQKGATTVYNQYESADDDVPMYKIEGTIDVPFDAAVEIIWDEAYDYPDFISEFLISVERVSPEGEDRRDLYVYRVPLIARIVTRVGSFFKGTLGAYQYATLELKKEGTNECVRMNWTNVPTPVEVTLKGKAFEVVKNAGYWEIFPETESSTRFVYVLDAYPGGASVPARVIRWGNRVALSVPGSIEDRYKQLKKADRY